MDVHKITAHESQFLDSVSNKIYDHAGDKLDISDDRRDDLTRVAINAMRAWLKDGK